MSWKEYASLRFSAKTSLINESDSETPIRYS
jgi:hypothetical protein